MGRPRQHDLGILLDQARGLWVSEGIEAVTTRALSAASGVSNGAIYHAFGSRDGLLAAVWAREAARFLALQRDLVAAAADAGPADPAAAVVAAALAPAAYAVEDEAGARLLLSTTGDRLLAPGLDDVRRGELLALQGNLGLLVKRLAGSLWGRRDRAAVTTVRWCVVDLPGALLLRGGAVTDPLARRALELAVRGVVSEPPPRVTSR